MGDNMDQETVLVTGASGFIASHLITLLLREGYKVKGTVRSLKNEAKVKPLRDLDPTAQHPLELVEADLTDAKSWLSAVNGCSKVFHVASPVPAQAPHDEDEIIRPAVDGTLAVLKACTAHRVKRVVLTSSVAAIMGDFDGKDVPGKVFTEDDWTNLETAKNAYKKSKTMAEKAAWNYLEQLPDDNRFELAVINPVFVLGPLLLSADPASTMIIQKLMKRDMPLVPRFNFNIVDVRDVALAHLKAMTIPEAAGKRFITDGGSAMWLQDIAIVLDKEFQSQGYSIPTSHCPYPLLWLTSLFDKTVKLVLPMYNIERHMDNTQMRTVLKITPTDVKKTIIDTGYSLIEQGIIQKTKQYRAQQTPSTES